MSATALRTALATCVIAALATPSAAQDTSATEYLPSGPWAVDYAEDSCGLMRSFSDGENEVWMELRRIAPVGQSRFIVGGTHLGLTEHAPQITIFPERGPVERDLQVIGGDDSALRAVVTTLSTSEFEAGPQQVWRGEPVMDWESVERPPVEGIQVANAFDQTVILRTGAFDAPLAALATCMNDLIRTWGVEPDVLQQSVSLPQPVHEERWRMRVAEHYPRSGLRRSRNTRFPVTLLVGPDGRVARCRSPNALGDEDFEAVACAALGEYARFDPALDADGQPTYGFWFTHMVYFVN